MPFSYIVSSIFLNILLLYGSLKISVIAIPNNIDTATGMCDSQGSLYCYCRDLTLSCFVSQNNLTKNDPIWDRFQVHNTITYFELSTDRSTFDYIPKHIFPYFASTLKQINIMNILIVSLDTGTFDNLPVLEAFGMSHCSELQFTQPGVFRSLPSLRKVSISNAKLTVLENMFQNVSLLTEIYLDNNEISSIKPAAFSQTNSANYLSLVNNKISDIQREWFIGLLSLLELDLSQNRITSLPENVFAEMISLRQLLLSNNLIENIHPAAFNGLVNVQEINLEDNRISQLPSTTLFSVTRKLQILNIDNNKFEYLDGKVFYQNHNKRYIRITIKGNELQCSCGLLWMEEALETSFDSMIKSQLEKIYCRTDKLDDPVLIDYFNKTSNLSPKKVINFLQNTELMSHCRKLSDITPHPPLPNLPELEENFNINDQNMIESIVDSNSEISKNINQKPNMKLENFKSSSYCLLSDFSTILFILCFKFIF